MRILDVVGAQVQAEVRTRLRSPGTLVAILAAFAGSLLWIPDPRGRVASLSWRMPGGTDLAPVYTSSYVGFAASLVVASLVAWFGFYLVVGAVRRDRDCGVGAILAATPLSRGQYILGKFAAHALYLALVAAMTLSAGLVAFWRFGAGPFAPLDFFALPILISIPAVAVTASLALLFDVTPGLRGRAGLVIWFFTFLLLLVALPHSLAGVSRAGPGRLPIFDPAGFATQDWLVRQTVPSGVSISTGLIIHDRPVSRVPWPGVQVTARLCAVRALNGIFALAPLALAALLFDRFDPARSGRGRRRRAREGQRPEGTAVAAASPPAIHVGPMALAGNPARPSAAAALLAEARLIWSGANWIKWPLAASALAAAVLPAPAVAPSLAAFFLLLIPVVSESAAREELAGTRGLVFSQPGVPASPLLWKAGSLVLFLLALGSPAIVRAFAAAPIKGIELVFGLFFFAFVATACGWLTGGGKLFSALFLILWYAAINRLPAADFAGALSRSPSAATSAAYVLVGLAALAAAWLGDRTRER